MNIFKVELIDSILTILLSEIQTIEFGSSVKEIESSVKRKVKTSLKNKEKTSETPFYICIIYKNGLSDFLSGDEETLNDIYITPLYTFSIAKNNRSI